MAGYRAPGALVIRDSRGGGSSILPEIFESAEAGLAAPVGSPACCAVAPENQAVVGYIGCRNL